MKNHFKILIALSLVTVLVGFGSASATYAWYQLNLTKSISLRGTSLGHSAGLQIGFVTKADLSSVSELAEYTPEDPSADYGGKIYFPAQKETDDSNSYKSQGLTSDTVSKVLGLEGYSSSEVYPITTGARAENEKVDAYYEPPGYKSTFESYHPKASKKEYIHLSLAFLTLTGEGNPVPSYVYLEDYAFSASQNANESVRFYFESKGDFSLSEVFKPAATEEGTTVVGGPLDLDQDGVYDYLDGKEVYYGQKQDGKDVEYGNAYTSSVTGVTSVPNYDCFRAGNHVAGVQPLLNVSDYAATAYYDTLDKYVVDPSLKASQNRPVALSDNNGIALLDIDIFLEGWDTHTVNPTIGAQIGATFSFTVLGNR